MSEPSRISGIIQAGAGFAKLTPATADGMVLDVRRIAFAVADADKTAIGKLVVVWGVGSDDPTIEYAAGAGVTLDWFDIAGTLDASAFTAGPPFIAATTYSRGQLTIPNAASLWVAAINASTPAAFGRRLAVVGQGVMERDYKAGIA